VARDQSRRPVYLLLKYRERWGEEGIHRERVLFPGPGVLGGDRGPPRRRRGTRSGREHLAYAAASEERGREGERSKAADGCPYCKFGQIWAFATHFRLCPVFCVC
jgi:hypothetical protein